MSKEQNKIQKIGVLVREARHEQGLSLDKLRDASQVHKSVLLKIEHGENYNITSLIRVLSTLKLNVTI